jgi:hypothetical protein
MFAALSPFIRSIHLLFIAIFLGLQIASYYYVITSQRSDSLLLQRYTLSLMLFIDCILLIIIACIYLTCAYLVYHIPTLSYTTPWIHAACVSLTIVVLCFCANMFIQYRNLKIMKHQMELGERVRLIKPTVKEQRKYNKMMHANYILIIFLLILTIHDAVARSTF